MKYVLLCRCREDIKVHVSSAEKFHVHIIISYTHKSNAIFTMPLIPIGIPYSKFNKTNHSNDNENK